MYAAGVLVIGHERQVGEVFACHRAAGAPVRSNPKASATILGYWFHRLNYAYT
jgi:hypothetical protein